MIVNYDYDPRISLFDPLQRWPSWNLPPSLLFGRQEALKESGKDQLPQLSSPEQIGEVHMGPSFHREIQDRPPDLSWFINHDNHH